MIDQDETPSEMVSRLRLIVAGERDCDMSDNDIKALRWLLDKSAAPSSVPSADPAPTSGARAQLLKRLSVYAGRAEVNASVAAIDGKTHLVADYRHEFDDLMQAFQLLDSQGHPHEQNHASVGPIGGVAASAALPATDVVASSHQVALPSAPPIDTLKDLLKEAREDRDTYRRAWNRADERAEAQAKAHAQQLREAHTHGWDARSEHGGLHIPRYPTREAAFAAYLTSLDPQEST